MLNRVRHWVVPELAKAGPSLFPADPITFGDHPTENSDMLGLTSALDDSGGKEMTLIFEIVLPESLFYPLSVTT